MIRAVTMETPTLDRLPTNNAHTAERPIPANAFGTPSNSPPDDAVIKKNNSTKTVQFGTPSAAEYEKDCPPKELTPMPSEVAKQRFPLTEPIQQEEEEEAIEETKHNSATLAEWDNDFDSYLSSDDDEDDESDEELESLLFSRKCKSRRNSGFFSLDSSYLLLPSSEETEEMQNYDLSTDVNIESLAVRSPLCEDALDGAPMDLGSLPSKRLDLSQQSNSMDTTPPSDFQLSNVNSTGGALPDANPREAPMIPSRQLHGALERCAKDDNVSVE